MGADWRSALEEVCSDPSRVEPVYQPIVDTSRGRACGYEALARFRSNLDAGPAEWFAAAALHGYGPLLEATVLARMMVARESLPPDCFLSVNVSPGSLVSEEVTNLLDSQTDLRGLVLEITEQTPVEDYDELSAALRGWRDRGAAVAVDDAGSGYASLRHVLALEPQFVKLDRALIAGVHDDTRKVAAVTALGAFASSLDAWLVAEGIEEPEELDVLLALHVPLGQGYLLGRPEPAVRSVPDDVSRRIRSGARRQRAGGLGALMEHAPATREIDSGPRADQVLGVETARMLFLLDEFGRPREVVLRSASGAPGLRHPAMCTSLETSPSELAVRAMARPSAERFTPVACCDERGRLLGVVRVERLVEALARPEIAA